MNFAFLTFYCFPVFEIQYREKAHSHLLTYLITFVKLKNFPRVFQIFEYYVKVIIRERNRF